MIVISISGEEEANLGGFSLVISKRALSWQTLRYHP
jgi:hypothetical protein